MGGRRRGRKEAQTSNGGERLKKKGKKHTWLFGFADGIMSLRVKTTFNAWKPEAASR